MNFHGLKENSALERVWTFGDILNILLTHQGKNVKKEKLFTFIRRK
jgi:hypothetical protein